MIEKIKNQLKRDFIFYSVPKWREFQKREINIGVFSGEERETFGLKFSENPELIMKLRQVKSVYS
jgi:hypothetical protein